jgi:hypothetical protein
MNSYSSPKFTQLPIWRVVFLQCKSIVINILHKLIRQRGRVRYQVKSDYDQKEWRGHLNATKWEHEND